VTLKLAVSKSRPSVPHGANFSHGISKTDAARIIELDTEMFHDDSLKPVYFWINRLNVKVTSPKNIAGVGICTPVRTGFFSFFFCLWKV